ncbi:hypothetical protein D3C86_1964790 [compost metagenome]
MAVAAIEPERADVVGMAEGDRLRARHPHPGDVGGLEDGVGGAGDRDRQQHERQEREACNGVGASSEELGHAWRLASWDQGRTASCAA